MKKIIVGAMILLSVSMSAQFLSNVRFGGVAGLNYSRVKNAHNPSGPRYTFQAGVLAEIPITSDDQFYLQPELVYYGAGETGKDPDAKNFPGYDALYANNYISVPIYLKAFFSERKSEFFGLIGPRFNILINQNVKNPAKDGYTIDGAGNIDGKASGFNMAIGAGVGYSYKRKLELTIRGDFGLLNAYKGLLNEGDTPELNKSAKEHVISVGVNYIFD
ncbi:MAG: hypothetical protein CSA38_03610 [Flavobacteriales bacterium]|nr:MAG: hypothetical protein CSA38_03610 [Flavobacteriales bacterium]